MAALFRYDLSFVKNRYAESEETESQMAPSQASHPPEHLCEEALSGDVCAVQTPQRGHSVPREVTTPEKENLPQGYVKLQVSTGPNPPCESADEKADQENLPPVAEPPGAAGTVPEKKPDESISQTVSLVFDQVDWLEEMASKYSLASRSHVIQRLMLKANSEPAKIKRLLFLVIRCRRCLQHQKGGTKKDCTIELTSQQWQWLEMIRSRSRHSSTDKTLRIILDFYMPLLKEDEMFERLVLTGTA